MSETRLICISAEQIVFYRHRRHHLGLQCGNGKSTMPGTNMLNLPNIITLVRIALVIVFTIALTADGAAPFINGVSPMENMPYEGWFVHIRPGTCIALWAFVAGAISDFLDGYLARKYNLITNFGKLIDPLADKILVSAAFIYLTYVGMCPFWVTILIIFREFLVTGLRQLAVEKGVVMAADKSGKWKTGMQLGYCIACLVHLAYAGNLPEPLHSLSVGLGGEWIRGIFLWSSVILTLWSGIHYCISSRSFLRG
ncbi:MAG: CDP-diacylglycerol--glycerol-3-phosphate 3-phosphatidyltransferase [Akkermansia sp.]|nr:CDP-diacylglycerol--glycerol-3-phosphate 3-phosphatidyltransferase [Akkermansia sp.]